jgi:heme O synthase-like polyprenyltransferase
LAVLAVRAGQTQPVDSPQADPQARSSSRSAGGAPAVSEAPLTRKQSIGAYVKLNKPWIIVLLLVTTFAAMLIAQKGLPPLPLVFFTLLGGRCGRGPAINSYRRDIDGYHEPHRIAQW